jgi:hypothetical protein
LRRPRDRNIPRLPARSFDRRGLVDLADRRENAIGRIRLRQKLTTNRHLVSSRRLFSGGNNNLYRRPAVPDRGSEPKAVHRSRHVYVGYDDASSRDSKISIASSALAAETT